ncbi:serine/threonine-protein phosphatase [Christensenellaceae bacterium OttesenSCG-928-M15]|nr:serine/threonine-protein phosphatase [Christensenellaceae bacterium OttesenSCG-928-M15]
MISFCTEVAYQSLNKYGEILCGDNVEVLTPDEYTTVMVLADGLGSGVKASILSTLTSKIISTMIARDMSLTDCVLAIAATLPVCSVRQIAYSTFTIIRIVRNNRAEIIQFDNPRVVLLRDGYHHEFPVTTETIEGKKILKSELSLQEGDTFLAFSDGVEHAGVGRTLNFGWQRKDIIEYMEGLYKSEYTAHTLTGILLEQCNEFYKGEPGDDATVCTIKVRRRMPVSLLIGPPREPEDVEKMMDLFFAAKTGKHIVCGGTTATLAAEYLHKPLNASMPDGGDPEIPPVAYIEGVDLVTEGIITINKVLSYSHEYLKGKCGYYDLKKKKDGASQIACVLFEEATDISFYVGRAINPAHQNPALPINFSIKMRLVQELIENLEKMGKHVRVHYF